MSDYKPSEKTRNSKAAQDSSYLPKQQPRISHTEMKPMLSKYNEGNKFLSQCPSPKSHSFYDAKKAAPPNHPNEKTKFYNNLVYVYIINQSEFQHITQPGTFTKEERRIEQEPSSTRSPGPAAYENTTRSKSPGGVIPKQKREFLVNEKEAKNTPGPVDYQPKYHFISKLKW